MSVTQSEIVDDLYQKLYAIGIKTRQEWYRLSVIAFLRHKGQCEYCGFDLFSSRQAADHLWHIDHLLPQSLCGELANPSCPWPSLPCGGTSVSDGANWA
jgi:hypothetical protein